MLQKNLISLAYETYADVLDIINIITDNDYLSISEISKLLCKILDTNSIEPSTINKILLDNNVIIKSDKKIFNSEKERGLKPSKFVPSNSLAIYCKKKYYNDISFYLWKFDMVLILLKLDFRDNLTIKSVKELCKIMKNYVHIDFNIDVVFTNLVKLQIILRQDSIFF